MNSRFWLFGKAFINQPTPPWQAKTGALTKNRCAIGAEGFPRIQKTIANKGVLNQMKLGIVG